MINRKKFCVADEESIDLSLVRQYESLFVVTRNVFHSSYGYRFFVKIGLSTCLSFILLNRDQTQNVFYPTTSFALSFPGFLSSRKFFTYTYESNPGTNLLIFPPRSSS
jgi:hypothetical protein